MLLQKVMKDEHVEAVSLIKMAVANVDEHKTKKCAQYGLDCIEK
jgi:hypothetical protein